MLEGAGDSRTGRLAGASACAVPAPQLRAAWKERGSLRSVPCSTMDPEWGGPVLGSGVWPPHLGGTTHRGQNSSAHGHPGHGSNSEQSGAGGRRAQPTPLTLLSSHLSADLLLLTGLASSVFAVSELLKLCERLCSRAKNAQAHQEDV